MTNYELLNILIDIESEAMLRKQANESTEPLLDDVIEAFQNAESPFSDNVLDLVEALEELIEDVKEMYNLYHKI